MPTDENPAAIQPLPARCAAILERLCGLYGWRLDAGRAAALAGAMALAHASTEAPADRWLEQTCCRLRFADLFCDLDGGGARAEEALSELFNICWIEDGGNDAVRYSGYLFRSALLTVRRHLAGSTVSATEYELLAADAAGRALTTVQARFRDCRDPDAFWGWTARIAERAAIDELRSGRATGGSSVRAASLDEANVSGPASEPQERQVDAIAVRQELVRKCRLGKLSLDQREALVRSFWGGEKPQEIAAALSAERGSPVTAAQVSLWKHRGLQVMEANLRGRGYA